MWTFVRCLVLLLTASLSAIVLALSIHLQIGRWSLSSLNLTPEAFNTTHVGSYAYDPSTETVNPTGLYVAQVVDFVGIVLGGASLFLAGVSFLGGLLRCTSCTSTVFVELLWTFVMSTFWLGMTIIDVMGTTFPLIGSCGGMGLCIELQILKVVSLANWLLFTGYFLTVFTLSGVGISRGKKSFTANTITNDFYSRKPRAPNTRDSAISERPRSGFDNGFFQHGQGTPIQVHLNMSSSTSRDLKSSSTLSPDFKNAQLSPEFKMSSSMSRDAQLVADNWHEMKSVPRSIESPQPRMFAQNFSLGSDDGVEDIDLDDDIKSKALGDEFKVKVLGEDVKTGEDVKVKPLV